MPLRILLPLLTCLIYCGAKAAVQQAPLSPQELATAIKSRVARVAEFKFIHDWAAEKGLRVWLFGGTAAGFAHYVRHDMMSKKDFDQGASSYRYDYDYTNIYRSSQDLDIVMDGSVEDIRQLQLMLQNHFRHFQGNKTAWEVRPLRQRMGTKEPLLGDWNFRNQHTDSNSMGMIEITDPPASEPAVRDLMDWESQDSQFLSDVAAGKISFYFSKTHKLTQRSMKGINPPIFSVIRFLTKAFQYELEIEPQDMATIQEIIKAFHPGRKFSESYVGTWIQKNGAKLIQNASNMEYARDMLQKLGLREKLLSIGSKTDSHSLAWWMDKEPLRTKDIGKGWGKTAAQLGISKVTHATRSYEAWESITLSADLRVNGWISRPGGPDETAEYGQGFYTLEGESGVMGRFNIQFEVDPRARAGTDFKLVARSNRPNPVVLILNKAILKVIPRSLNLGFLEFFQLLSSDNEWTGRIDEIVLEKLRRRMLQKEKLLSAEVDQVAHILREKIADGTASQELLDNWFVFESSLKYPDIIESLAARRLLRPEFAYKIFGNAAKARSLEFSRFANALVEKAVRGSPADYGTSVAWLSSGLAPKHPQLAFEIFVRLYAGVRTGRVFAQDESLAGYQSLRDSWDLMEVGIEFHMKNGFNGERYPVDWAGHEDMQALVTGPYPLGKRLSSIVWSLFQNEKFINPEMAAFLIREGFASQVAEAIQQQPAWAQHPEIFRQLMSALPKLGAKPHSSLQEVQVLRVLGSPGWEKHPELLDEWIEARGIGAELLNHVLSKSYWYMAVPERLDEVFRMKAYRGAFIAFILPQEYSKNHPEWIEAVLEQGTHDEAVIPYLERLSDERKEHWVKEFLKEGKTDQAMAEKVFNQPWAKSEWAQAFFLKRGNKAYSSESAFIDSVLLGPLASDEWFDRFIEEGLFFHLAFLFEKRIPEMRTHPQWFEKLMKAQASLPSEHRDHARRILMRVLDTTHWLNEPRREKWIRTLKLGPEKRAMFSGTDGSYCDYLLVKYGFTK